MTTAYAKASESFTGDFIVSFTLNSAEDFFPASFGIMPADAPIATTSAGAVQLLYPGLPYFSNPSGSNVAPMGDTGYQVTGVSGDEFSIHRSGDVIRFYKNIAGAVPIPIMETSATFSSPVQVYIEFDVTTTIAIQPFGQVRVQYTQEEAYRYTVNQQIEDFGSVQGVGAVKTRAYQESALVGRGDYIERLL